MRFKTNLNDILEIYTDLLTPERVDNTVRTVATTMLARMQTRIYEEGKNAKGGQIGKYSKSPMYVSAAANPGRSFGRPIGKTGKSKFKGGKKAGQDHKSRYFEGGYDAFKKAIGRNPGYVNLSLSGQLNSQMTVIATDKGYGIGWADNEKIKRALALEKKYGKIFSLTEEEQKQASEIAGREFFNVIKT